MTNNLEVIPNAPWNEYELEISVDTYVMLLRLQIHGADAPFAAIAYALLIRSLPKRNSAAIRYRMRNISAVVRELGGATLNDFSPAESVGSGVRLKIKAMLLQNAEFSRILSANRDRLPETISEARAALHILHNQVEELERDFAWRGHNGPPENERLGLDSIELHEALDDIDTLSQEIDKPDPDLGIVKARKDKLLIFVKKIGNWIAERVTKFADATLESAGTVLGPIVVVKVAGLLPSLANAIEAISKIIGK